MAISNEPVTVPLGVVPGSPNKTAATHQPAYGGFKASKVPLPQHVHHDEQRGLQQVMGENGNYEGLVVGEHHGSKSKVNIIDIRRAAVELDLKDQILSMFHTTQGPRQLPTLLLYDARGLQLFEDVRLSMIEHCHPTLVP
jgi:hypothetical protein